MYVRRFRSMPPLTRIPKHPVTAAWALYKLWSRLPPAQRRQMVDLARAHGPRLAAKASETAKTRVRSRLRP